MRSVDMPEATDAPLASADDFIGVSSSAVRLKQMARAVAPRPTTICLLGETGSGKEMAARYVHRHSRRAAKPFIAIDCSAFAETLFESQLFGHVKGAFTGAMRDALGFARAADGGTLFLDEVGELSLGLQAKLLRVIQERCVVPVGGVEPISINVRLICATNRNLRHMVESGSFRQDLFFRLHVVTLHIPPLRERVDDIPLLADAFLARQAELSQEPAKTLTPDAMERIGRYHWPGNVRELFNALEHAHVMSRGSLIQPEDLPPPLSNPQSSSRPPSGPASDLNLAHIERQAILEALRRARFNRTAASRLLGIELRRLNRRMQSLNIPLPRSL
jgi:transcriptional regulator with PAS, ATPase and Fis domain